MFVIGKSASPRCFKHVRNLPCRYRSQKKAWMSTSFIVSLQCKLVMIVDNCPVHPEVSGLKAINLQFLPPNIISCTQPIDQGVVRYVCFIIFYFIKNVNRITIECLDFAVEGLHCLNNSLI